MDIDRSGIILYTLKFQECINFYGQVLKLPILFSSFDLVCYEFGDSYLMVEKDDEFQDVSDPAFRTRTYLRMNVQDVAAVAHELSKKGVEVDYQEHSWGTVAKFKDPDGNLCAFKDSEKFEQQILGAK